MKSCVDLILIYNQIHTKRRGAKKHGIKISMDGKGRAMDNIMVERLWRTVKYEEIYLRDYESVKDLKQHLKIYFDFYNHLRPHQTFEGKTPAEIYWGETKQQKAA